VPFFKPMWRRVAALCLLAGWTVVELSAGSPYWAMLVGGIGLYAAWVFFFDFDLGEADPDE
jgi:hypothetical protein